MLLSLCLVCFTSTLVLRLSLCQGIRDEDQGEGRGVYYLFNELFTIKRFAPRSLLTDGWMNV